jgi:ABC-type polysaccharide/polyol phosphate export permease
MAEIVTWRARDPLGRSVRTALIDIRSHAGLLWMLVVKDLKIKYKASALGLFWSLLNPLLLMIVYTAIFGTLFGSKKPEFPVFVLSGLLVWNFFGTALPAATISIVNSSNLVRKTRFPTALLPMSVVISGCINFLVSLVLLFGLLAYYRHPVGVSLLVLPVLLLAQVAFTMGLGLLFSSLNVFFRDVEHFLGIVLTVWFFATPIIYPREDIVAKGNQLANTILAINPMAWLVASYQAVFYGVPDAAPGGGFTGGFQPGWPDPLPFFGFLGLSLALLVVGFVVFTALSRRFVEEV